MNTTKQFRDSVWLINSECECGYCLSWVDSALVECVVFGDGKFQRVNITTPDHTNIITVENWSR